MQEGYFSLTFRIFGCCVLYFLLVAGTQAECPLQLNPQRVVVRHGGSAEANCNTSVVSHEGMGWEASQGVVPMTREKSLITWRVPAVTEWDIKPFCYINIDDQDQCEVHLPVTVYKTPDSVSIITVNHRGPMKEGEQYELQCEVLNVAPVQNLTVKWYKGQTLLNQTSFTDTIQTPVNKIDTLLIRPDRDDDGAQYRCEAELDLGAEGPQPPPKVTSHRLNAEVYYKPQHSSSTESIIKGQEVMMNCTVKANPAPTYTWDHLEEKISSSVLQSSTLDTGNYTCTATNTEGSDSKVFIIKDSENHIPIILVVVFAVVGVIILFIVIYLIYYKQKRMGHYDLKKSKAHKGLLAQPEPSP